MLPQHGIATALRVEEAGAEITIEDQHGDGTGQHRQLSSSRNAVTSIAQINSGILCSVMPGVRMLKIVVMKFSAPSSELMPARCSATT